MAISGVEDLCHRHQVLGGLLKQAVGINQDKQTAVMMTVEQARQFVLQGKTLSLVPEGSGLKKRICDQLGIDPDESEPRQRYRLGIPGGLAEVEALLQARGIYTVLQYKGHPGWWLASLSPAEVFVINNTPGWQVY